MDPPSESDKCETNIPYQDYGLVCCRKCYRRRYITPPPTICTTLAGYGIAERDGERRESGRRACLRIGTACGCGAGLVRDTVRARTACVLTDRDGVRATDRDDERHGAGPDGERTVGTAFDMRCGYDRRVRTVRFGTMCERVTERALRALLPRTTT